MSKTKDIRRAHADWVPMRCSRRQLSDDRPTEALEVNAQVGAGFHPPLEGYNTLMHWGMTRNSGTK